MSGAAYARAFSRWSEHDARAQLRAHWGLRGTDVVRLSTERDDTFRIATDRGVVVLKASNPDDPAAASDGQIRVLRLLERSHPDLPVERIVPTADGSASVAVEGRTVRVTTFLHGEALSAAPRTDPELASYGSTLARLHCAVAEVDLDPRATPWNLLALEAYAEVAGSLASDLRAPVAAVLERARAHTVPALRRLSSVLAHNDFHGDNILVDQHEPQRITGILDFGDLTRTPRAAEAAVAASYARGYAAGDPAPWHPAAVFVAGYRDGLAAVGAPALSDDEEALLPELVLLRLAQRALLNSEILRSTQNPYAARNLSRLAHDLTDLGADVPRRLEDPR